MTVTPYKNITISKKQQIEVMFNNIASHYDFLNHFLSLGIDVLWRKKAVSILKKENPKIILDIATGTADFAIENLNVNPDKVIGIDIAEEMLAKGRKKITDKNLSDKIEIMKADAENLPFSNNTFDAITVGYGVRNFENLENGLKEMLRVLKPNGVAVILEFSKPKTFLFKHIYNIYFLHILPFLGKLISNDKNAYSYLPESVKFFPDGPEFLEILKKTGFKELKCVVLTFGISSIYVGRK